MGHRQPPGTRPRRARVGGPGTRGAVFAGEIVDTLGSGAVVDLGEGSEGFLPYANSPERVDDGDCLRVQVTEPAPPWGDDRPVLDATMCVQGSLATLVHGGTAVTNGPALADILSPTDPGTAGARGGTRRATTRTSTRSRTRSTR